MRAALIAVLVLLTASVAWAADNAKHNRYRWHDADGNLHYGDALPAEAGKYGYDVISPQGVVLKHVERAKTAEERIAAKAELAKAQAAKDAVDARVRGDQQMLSSYPTEDDLKRAQKQRSEMLDQNLVSARISLESQEKSLAELLGHAAELDASGKAVPTTLAKRIGDMRKQVEDQRAYIARKENERNTTIAQFDDELAHYRALKAPKDSAKQ